MLQDSSLGLIGVSVNKAHMSHGFLGRLSLQDLNTEIIPEMISEICFMLCARKLSEGFPEARSCGSAVRLLQF